MKNENEVSHNLLHTCKQEISMVLEFFFFDLIVPYRYFISAQESMYIRKSESMSINFERFCGNDLGKNGSGKI